MQRLNEAYKHLYAFHGIVSKTALADKLKVQRTGLSAALNGSKANLTDNLFMKICAAFPGVFNLDYLLNGTGTLLAQQKETGLTPASPATDNLLELHASMLRHVDDLRQDLHAELSEVQSLRHSLSEELSAIRELKDELRATLQELQRSNNAILAELQRSNNHDIGIAAETLDKH
jgi:hypothetical protein